jgi:hypothetical protein
MLASMYITFSNLYYKHNNLFQWLIAKSEKENDEKRKENDGHDDARCKRRGLGNTFCLLPFDMCTTKQANSIN